MLQMHIFIVFNHLKVSFHVKKYTLFLYSLIGLFLHVLASIFKSNFVSPYFRAKPDVLLRAILQCCDAMLQY